MSSFETLTKEEFVTEVAVLVEQGASFGIESVDAGSVMLGLFDCQLQIDLDMGVDGEIVIFKPFANMEVRLDFDIIDEINRVDDNTYSLEFNNGMSNVEISFVTPKPVKKNSINVTFE